MSNDDLSGVIAALIPHFEAHRLEFLIVGAKARDLIASAYGLPLSKRKTADVDLGVLVDRWETLDSLRTSFRGDSRIRESTARENMVRYFCGSTPFDIVPFGKKIETDGKISWPPHYDSIMTVTGYQQAFENALEFEIADRKVRVVSPEMLIALKFVSWDENRTRDRDPQDIIYIIENYARIDPDADLKVYDTPEILEAHNHDMDLGVVSLLGVRMAKVLSPDHRDLIMRLLADSDERQKLASRMRSELIADPDEAEMRERRIETKLKALLLGLESA